MLSYLDLICTADTPSPSIRLVRPLDQAVHGYNRFHSLIGTDNCGSTPSSLKGVFIFFMSFSLFLTLLLTCWRISTKAIPRLYLVFGASSLTIPFLRSRWYKWAAGSAPEGTSATLIGFNPGPSGTTHRASSHSAAMACLFCYKVSLTRIRVGIVPSKLTLHFG